MRVAGPPPIPPRQTANPHVDRNGFDRSTIEGKRAALAHARKSTPVGKGVYIDPKTGRPMQYGRFSRAAVTSSIREVQNWNGRHQLVLWMDVAGMGTNEIAAQIGYSTNWVRAIRSSPLYLVQKEKLYQTLQQGTLLNILDKIRVDAPRNIEFLIKSRDGEIEPTAAQMAAAGKLAKEADRVYPRVTKHIEDRVVRITIDGQKLVRLAGAMREMGAPIDAELIGGLDAEGSRPAPIAGKSVEQLLAEIRAATTPEPE